jgi:hypothetical protein
MWRQRTFVSKTKISISFIIHFGTTIDPWELSVDDEYRLENNHHKIGDPDVISTRNLLIWIQKVAK